MCIRHYAALLRGVNVAGHRRLAMAELRGLLEHLGYLRVSTYLQSGQAVFDAGACDDDVLARRIRKALADEYAVDVDVIVRDHAYLAGIVSHCPFPVSGSSGTQLHVMYCSAEPDATALEQINGSTFLPDRFAVGDRAVYCFLPNGIGRSKLAARLAGPRVLGQGVVATVRNWNTVAKLAAMTDGC